MKGASWVALLRRIPPAMHGNLVLVTTTNTEIVVQNLVRLERDFVVIRGRMSGSQDSGRIVIIPYDQINYAGFVKKVEDADLQAILGKPGVAATAEPAEEGAVAAGAGAAGAAVDDEVVDFLAAAIEEAAATAAEPQPAEDESPAAAKPSHPSKTVLLARLRARLGAENPSQVKPGKPARP
jgi:hypothetical protein